MKILDWYILKRYLGTFITLLLLFIPIGITVNLAEKIDKILENEVPFIEVANYYLNFTIYFANLLFPLFLFLSVIWFTSKLANNTEIIAFLSSGVSFYRFLRPYLIGATIVCFGAFILGMFLAPAASKGFNEFKYTYLKRGGDQNQETKNVYRQINDDEVIFATNFNPTRQNALNFTLEHFNDNVLEYKISANRLQYNEKDSTYTLTGYEKRLVGARGDSLISKRQLDTILPFEFDELTPQSYIAETLNFFELGEFIEQERRRGSGNVNRYLVVAYKRWSTPVSAFILTIIAVAVSAMKRRGGMGINLAIGISVAFSFVFLDKVLGTIAEQSDFSPMIAVWFPNVSFGILAIYLLYNAKR